LHLEPLKEQTDTENKKEIVYSDEEGKSKPITEKVVMPVIEGAITPILNLFPFQKLEFYELQVQ